MKLDIRNTSGATVGQVELDDAVWGAEVNEHILWEVVKWQRAKARSGTHSTRTVAMVRRGMERFCAGLVVKLSRRRRSNSALINSGDRSNCKICCQTKSSK